MSRLDPIFIDSPENIAAERQKMHDDLARMRVVRSETEGILAAHRLEVGTWLDSVIATAAFEKYRLKDSGDIADGEIESHYKLFKQAVIRLREAQRTLLYMDGEIESTVQTLADDELWKPWQPGRTQ